MATKMRVVVSNDLTPGQVAAQAIHAVATFARVHPEAFEAWQDGSNIIVVLATSTDDLYTLHARVRYRQQFTPSLTMASFLEPDMDDKLTAIALGPDTSGTVRDLTYGLRLYGSTKLYSTTQ